MSKNVAPIQFSRKEMLSAHQKDLWVEPEPLPTGEECFATCVLQVAYLGTKFAGVAAQEFEIRTVQGELERALSTLFNREVVITVSGRTDAGVHAVAQYVSFPISEGEALRNHMRIVSGLHALCADDISIRGIWLAAPEFSARQSALERTYIYRIMDGFSRPCTTFERVMWHRGKVCTLDIDAMQEAANLMAGEHEFGSFCKERSRKFLAQVDASTKRFVRMIDVYTTREASEDIICIKVVGNAFLHNMVRIMVGTLIEVGEGRRSIESIPELFSMVDRTRAGKTAEAKGLTFEAVVYPEGSLVAWDSYVCDKRTEV